MASIIQRNKKYSVVYTAEDEKGKRHQRWETFRTAAEANQRKIEIEYKKNIGGLVIPVCITLNDLLREYVSLYGKSVWSMSAYAGNTGLIKNYISPMIGDMKLNEITTRVLEKYYATLLKTKAANGCILRAKQSGEIFVRPPTIRKIRNLLRSAFTQAMKWDLMERNPATLATIPKAEMKKRDIWDAHTLFRAMESSDDERLKLCMNLAFACSLRLGEILGLTWNCVDITEDSIKAGTASLYICKEMQRVSKSALNVLEKKGIIATFPEAKTNNKTVLALKSPKTPSSIRKVFIPKTVAHMLLIWKEDQDAVRDALGDEYSDYQLVIAGPLGTPVEGTRISASFRRLIRDNELPPVVFHSLRHSSITYKLKLSGGDIKSVQGDSGHSQAKMVTDQYSHILDEDRVNNARLLESAFYGGQGAEPVAQHVKQEDKVAEQANAAGVDPELLMKILANPDMVNLLKSLSKNLGN